MLNKVKIIVLLIGFIITSHIVTASADTYNLKNDDISYIKPISKIIASKFKTSISLEAYTRTQLADNVQYDTYTVKIGDDEYNRIVLHHLFKKRNGKCKSKPVVLLPNNLGTFNTYFFPSAKEETINNDDAALYLANQGIEVWGIDYPACLLPDDVVDFSFMENWDMAYIMNDLQIAVKMIRYIRGFTGYGFGKVHLLGFGRGGQYTYIYANEETKKKNKASRDIKSIIPMDALHKCDPQDTDILSGLDQRYQYFVNHFNNGSYSLNQGNSFKLMASLALQAPDTTSAYFPDYTNENLLLYFVTANYEAYRVIFNNPIPTYTPYFHYLGGQMDEMNNGELYYTEKVRFFNIIKQQMTYFVSVAEYRDAIAISSGNDSYLQQYTDSLDKISIPVMYVGAAGGMGHYGSYIVNNLLTGCHDKKVHVVQLESDENTAADYGVYDLVFADNKISEVWLPVAEWIKNH